MLIPNKFNGYSRDGIRKYNVDGGVGEAMLLSAMMGGGTAAITGGDPLKGALLGGLSGGLGAGITGALGGAAPAALGETALETGAGILAPGAAGANAVSNLGTNLTGGLGTNLSQFSGSLAPTEAGIASLPSGSSMLNPALNPDIATNIPTGFNATHTGLEAGDQFLGSPSAMSNVALNPVPTGVEGGDQFLGTPKVGAPATGLTSFQQAMNDPLKYMGEHKLMMAGAGLQGAIGARQKNNTPGQTPYTGPLSRFVYNPSTFKPSMYAEGGITALGNGGAMTVGNNPMPAPNQYNQDGTNQRDLQYSTSPTQSMASGGISSLGGYSDGGRMLKGPGDGMSDSIPASIAGKRPARLATDEFVVPADVVSHLGNGSSDAGAKQLYSMMDKVRRARTGRSSQGRQINPGKYMPA